MGRRPGFTVSPKTRERISAAKKGQAVSESIRKNMSAAAERRWENPQYRKAQVVAIRRRFQDPAFMEIFKTKLKPRGPDKRARIVKTRKPQSPDQVCQKPVTDQYGITRKAAA